MHYTFLSKCNSIQFPSANGSQTNLGLRENIETWAIRDSILSIEYILRRWRPEIFKNDLTFFTFKI